MCVYVPPAEGITVVDRRLNDKSALVLEHLLDLLVRSLFIATEYRPMRFDNISLHTLTY